MYNQQPSFPSFHKSLGITIAVFILGIFNVVSKPMEFVSPISDSRVSILSQVRAKVEQKLNTYKLKKDLNMLPSINEVSASSTYDEASAYAVVDFDSGEVVAEKSLSQNLSIASLTKIMTAVTALDLISPDETITVTANASQAIPTKIVLDPGEKLTVQELLHAVLLTSANDAAQALSDGIDAKYNEEVFIDAMNMKARYIGLKNSRFANPQGFDDKENYSTVEDLAVLSHYALTHYPLISEIVKKEVEYLPATVSHKRYVLYNWNGLIGVYPDVYGVKIGNTDDAGMTTVVVSEREGKKLLTVVLGAPGVLERDLWASQLLDLGYEKTMNLPSLYITEDELLAKYATWTPWN
jgi:D-alanyl-D-alanine carboxypeptidase (penicillin-binding protein 5/6)